ncbi:type IV secretory system conjugative DNA transfer family protein [Streptomyces sp. NRRL WC-3742]|uniref:type IV secretory system conjugative DNA transfer family protein n=1 Tax=Streptomyces sp. NRRL WC-3742 TaxID=1463934 RepID=UPI0004CB4459|nr:type IV secretory system conjugative DNA transfer family protein [Streptomyces sp. NRRL WC-3742]
MMTENDRLWLGGGVLVVGAAALSASTWTGAALGAAVTEADVPPLSPYTVFEMTRDWTAVWPQSPTASAVGAVLLDLVVVAALTWGLWACLRRFHNASHLATLHQVRDLTPQRAARTATRLRASLRDVKPRKLAPRDRGVLLGDHLPSDVELRGSDEDTYLALMAPRAGKSSAIAIPVAVEAPAALLVTSNKPDVYAATLASRQKAGTVWAFDTQGVAQISRSCWWDIIAEAETLDRAERLATHFVNQVKSDAADPFWAQGASDLLVGMFRAAWWDGATVRDVLTWVADPKERAPLRILYQHEEVLAEQVESSVNIAEETQSGIYQNARTAISALRDENVLAWMMPDRYRPRFRPEEFALGRDTLYLLSKKGGASSAVVAALADAVFTAASEAGERHSGRLPEPMRAVLDEAANICNIADLPDLYSHLGSRGITPYTILQSYSQGVRAWGEAGMSSLWGAATKKVIGVGLDDARFVNDIATLVGNHEITRGSYSKSRDGGSTSVSEHREQILEPAQIRALKRGTALLLSTGMPVAQIALRPWYLEDTLGHLAPAMRAEEAAIAERANMAWEKRKAGRRG